MFLLSGAAAWGGDAVPPEYRLVEQASRAFLDAIRVPTRDLQFHYVQWGKAASFAEHHRNNVYINVDHYPRNIHSFFHEVWHHVQQHHEGVRRFEASYGRWGAGSNLNPYEVEAKLVADRLQRQYEAFSGSPFYKPQKFANAAAMEIRRMLPALQAEWSAADLSPAVRARFRSLGDELAAFEKRNGMIRSTKLQALGRDMGQFTLAYLVKAACDAALKRDPSIFGERAQEILTPRGAGSMALAFGVSGGMSRLTKSMPVGKTYLPLITASAAVDLANGRFEPESFVVTSAATYGSAHAVNLVCDRVLFPALAKASPTAQFFYSTAKLVLTMNLTEGVVTWSGHVYRPKGLEAKAKVPVAQP